MKSLILGHSKVKYFDQYVSTDDIQCLSYSGCTIEELLTVNDNEAQDFVRRSEVGHIVIVIFLVGEIIFFNLL